MSRASHLLLSSAFFFVVSALLSVCYSQTQANYDIQSLTEEYLINAETCIVRVHNVVTFRFYSGGFSKVVFPIRKNLIYARSNDYLFNIRATSSDVTIEKTQKASGEFTDVVYEIQVYFSTIQANNTTVTIDLTYNLEGGLIWTKDDTKTNNVLFSVKWRVPIYSTKLQITFPTAWKLNANDITSNDLSHLQTKTAELVVYQRNTVLLSNTSWEVETTVPQHLASCKVTSSASRWLILYILVGVSACLCGTLLLFGIIALVAVLCLALPSGIWAAVRV